MVRQLSEGDIVELIQQSLPEGFIAVAHFNRDQEYIYLSFIGMDDIIAFLRQKDVDDVWINQDPCILYFLSDEWFIFTSQELASKVAKSFLETINWEI